MMEVIGYTLGFAVVLYGVVMLMGALGLGELGLLIGVFLMVGGVLAGLYVSYQNTQARLDRLEKKLDGLLKQRDVGNESGGKN